MKILISFLTLLMFASTAFSGGNKALMTQAESELRDLNKKILKQVPKDQIPANGRIQVNVKVKSTEPELILTDLKVKTIESKSTTGGK